MKNGKTWSCGCTALKKRHGLTKSGEFHPMYLTWRSIKARCTDPGNENWANYGGRGIGMWEPWIDDPAFFCHGVTALLGPKPGPEYSLDRIDNDGDYAPGNIRWATQSQQMRNTRRTVLTPEGVAEIREFVAYFCAKYPGVKPESMVNVIRGKSWVADV